MEKIKALIDKTKGLGIPETQFIKEQSSKYGIYPESIRVYANTLFFMARTETKKVLVVNGDLAGKFTGEEYQNAKICPCDVANAQSLMDIFEFTRPVRHKGKDQSIGLGDRLGMASGAHIRLLKGKKVFPVIAQQSIRELNLTRRTYHDVLASSVFAVFREGYEDGFGMDGDHLKSPEEVKMALDCGSTMITIDCSGSIDNRLAILSDPEIMQLYTGGEELAALYCDNPISLSGGVSFSISKNQFIRNYVIYKDAIDFIVKIYNDLIKAAVRPIDYEVSLDETEQSISPEAHYIIARELIKRGVEITSLAPRFVGEFQKGIDYIGDVNDFEKDITRHYQIAETLGYKLSVHSGSDKFMILPIVAKVTKGKWHLKTSGTNWLEAVHMICVKDPALFRQMYDHAKEVFADACRFYHVAATLDKMPDITNMQDSELYRLFEINDTRQLMHITYGSQLNDLDSNGQFLFRDAILNALYQYEHAYDDLLINHIGRHLTQLGIQ
ncbi:MAG: tagaturonate epimerase family protein [Christensenellales bacterium]|jgi:hypothetical protein